MFADKNIADWIYNKGSEDNIVLYSKVSIYRNLENIRFHYNMDKDEIDKIKIEDRIYRSKAILSSARKLTYSEIIKYSFWLRAGLYYDMPEMKNIELDDLYYILFITKNNHLKNLNNQNNTQNINEIRANIIREIFNNK